jgi:hypothetical protein
VVIKLKGSFLAAVKGGKTLQLWTSDLNSGNDEGVNPPDKQLFVRGGKMVVASDGTVRITLAPETMATITTLSTGSKGTAASPPSAPFPIPFSQSFDDERVSAPPRFWYDQMGAWEIQSVPRSGAPANLAMRQVLSIILPYHPTISSYHPLILPHRAGRWYPCGPSAGATRARGRPPTLAQRNFKTV